MVPWWDDAACYGHPPELWDTYTAALPRDLLTEQERAAKAICRSCPVTDACLTDVLEWESSDLKARETIRGGLNPAERSRLRRKKAS